MYADPIPRPSNAFACDCAVDTDPYMADTDDVSFAQEIADAEAELAESDAADALDAA